MNPIEIKPSNLKRGTYYLRTSNGIVSSLDTRSMMPAIVKYNSMYKSEILVDSNMMIYEFEMVYPNLDMTTHDRIYVEYSDEKNDEFMYSKMFEISDKDGELFKLQQNDLNGKLKDLLNKIIY